MRFLFVVQGEGRGHMTQAISLRQMLEGQGHHVCAVCMGRSRARAVPQFFLDKMGSPVIFYESPNFKTDPSRRGISIVGNAVDASLSGAGIWGFDFDLERFLDYLPRHRGHTEEFRSWVDRGEKIYPELFAGLIS